MAVARRVLGAIEAVLDPRDLGVGVDEKVEPEPAGAVKVEVVGEVVALLIKHAHLRGRLRCDGGGCRRGG